MCFIALTQCMWRCVCLSAFVTFEYVCNLSVRIQSTPLVICVLDKFASGGGLLRTYAGQDVSFALQVKYSFAGHLGEGGEDLRNWVESNGNFTCVLTGLSPFPLSVSLLTPPSVSCVCLSLWLPNLLSVLPPSLTPSLTHSLPLSLPFCDRPPMCNFLILRENVASVVC